MVMHQHHLEWEELPAEVREGIADRLGGVLRDAKSVRTDKPHFLGFLSMPGDAQVFVKVVSVKAAFGAYVEACRREIQINELFSEHNVKVPQPALRGYGVVTEPDGQEWLWLATDRMPGSAANEGLTAENLHRFVQLFDRTQAELDKLPREKVPPGLLMSPEEFLLVVGDEPHSWEAIFKLPPARLRDHLPDWADANQDLLVALGRRGDAAANSQQRLCFLDLTFPNVVLGGRRDEEAAVDWGYLGIGTPWARLVASTTAALKSCTIADLEASWRRAALLREVSAEEIDGVLASHAALVFSAVLRVPQSRELSGPAQVAWSQQANKIIQLMKARIDHRALSPDLYAAAQTEFQRREDNHHYGRLVRPDWMSRREPANDNPDSRFTDRATREQGTTPRK